MRQYIVNLTNHLIGKSRYDETFYRIGNPDKFVEHVKTDLEAGDVRTMSPAKLGEIMCSFEIGDVMAGKKDLFNGVHFSGDCEEMLRELVSLCLAFAIMDRLIRRIVMKHLDRKPFSVEEACREVCQELNRSEPNSEHSVSPDDIRDNVTHAVLEIEKNRGVIPS